MIENIGKLGAGMSGTTPESQNSTLLDGPQDGAKPDASVIVQVAQKFGVSPAKLSREGLSLRVDASHTQAVTSGYCDTGDTRMLRNSEDITAFLTQDAQFPIFGKPLQGPQSAGTLRLERIEGDDLVRSNGQTRKVTDFANEVFERYPSGYLFQTALDPHPDMAAMSGDTLGSVRFVAINDGPAHGLYQQAAVRGVLNADFNPIWGSVIAHQKKRLARYKSTKKNVKG